MVEPIPPRLDQRLGESGLEFGVTLEGDRRLVLIGEEAEAVEGAAGEDRAAGGGWTIWSWCDTGQANEGTSSIQSAASRTS